MSNYNKTEKNRSKHLQEVATSDARPANITAETAAGGFASLLGSRVWIPLFAVCLLGYLLRLLDFDAYWVNPDEGIYYAIARAENWETFWKMYQGAAHPPLYYLILRGFSWLSADVTLPRSISLVAGGLWVPGMFLLMRECVGMCARSHEAKGESSVVPSARSNLAGLIMALIIAIAPGAIMFSSVARPYAFQLVMVIFGLYFLVHYLRRSTKRSLMLYTTCMAIALLTHYSALMVLGVVGITMLLLLLFRQLELDQIRALLFAHVPLLIIFLLLYFLHMRQIVNATFVDEAMTGWLKPYLYGNHLDAIFRLQGFFGGMFGGINSWMGTIHSLHAIAGLLFLGGVAIGIWQRRPLIYLLPLVSWFVAALLSYTGQYPFGATRHNAYLTATTILPIAHAFSWAFAPTRKRGTNFMSTCLSVCLLILAFFWRTEVSAALSPSFTRVPNIFPTELNLRRTEMEQRVLPLLREITNVEGTIVMDRQTYYMLIPLYHLEQQRGEKRGKALKFRWGRRRVVVYLGTWMLSMDPKDRDKPRHLLNAVKELDRSMPELGLGQIDRIVFLAGGFGRVRFGRDLTKFGAPLTNPNLVYEFEQMTGLHMIEYNLAQGMIYVENDLNTRRHSE